MTATGSWVAQKALYSAITANSTIMGLVSSRVYDHVPEDADFPFIVLGEGTEEDASYFGQRAHDVLPEIQVWTQDGETSASSGSAGYKVALDIADKIADLIGTSGLTVDGHDCVVISATVEQLPRDRSAPDDATLRYVGVIVRLLLEDSGT